MVFLGMGLPAANQLLNIKLWIITMTRVQANSTHEVGSSHEHAMNVFLVATRVQHFPGLRY